MTAPTIPQSESFDRLLDRLSDTLAERDRARDTAVRLEALAEHYAQALRDIAASSTGEGLHAQAALDKAMP